jgi:hypothetical protein
MTTIAKQLCALGIAVPSQEDGWDTVRVFVSNNADGEINHIEVSLDDDYDDDMWCIFRCYREKVLWKIEVRRMRL